jgi:hypothetical protein
LVHSQAAVPGGRISNSATSPSATVGSNFLNTLIQILILHMKAIIIATTIFFVILFSFASCKKTNTNTQNTMSGIVVHYPSRQPASGIKVYLKIQGLIIADYNPSNYWSITNIDTLKPRPYYILDSTFTDANGKFSLTIPATCQGNACFGVYFVDIIDRNIFTVTAIPQFGHETDTIFIF